MKNIIVGTAGHIDHGKTTLIKALTGTDADRLPEEKRRGITIELGFAHLQLTPDIRVGFVDVPGHERFVRNMLAGVGGIDLVLFVVAADESIKPQTREHFDICRLLGIRKGIVVLTKSDLVSADLVELVQLEVEEFVAGSFLQGAPVVAVSAATGSGLDDLRTLLTQAAESVPPRDASGPARLPIDRAFSMRGFGTVVTGTLVSGSITRDQDLEMLPQKRTLRVRGIQTYGRPAERVAAGTRTALNLPDVEAQQVQRGMVLADKGRFEPTYEVDCSLQLLASARAIKNGAPVHFHAGTAEIEAKIRLFKTKAMEPGSTSFARLRFQTPAVLAPGDRYIIRQFSPVITIGGGSIIDVQPARKRRIADIEIRLSILAGDDTVAKVSLLIEESPHGIGADSLARRLGIERADALTLARQSKAMVIDPPGWAVTRAWLQERRNDLVRAVQQHHGKEPLAAGISKHELKARLLPEVPGFLFDTALTGIPELAVEGETIRHRTHRVVLSVDEEGARRRIVDAFESAGLAVPSVADVMATAGLDAARSQTLLRMLLKERVLVRISDELVFHQSAIMNLKALLLNKKDQRFTVSTFKEWTGVSRKYAVPLLEYLDREHVTIRKGDLRVVV